MPLIYLILILASGYSFAANPLYAPDYNANPGATPTNARYNYRYSITSQYGGAAYNLSEALDQTCGANTSCRDQYSQTIVTISLYSGTCETGQPTYTGQWTSTCPSTPCPVGGISNGTVNEAGFPQCTNVPWGQGTDPVTCEAGITKSMCVPGDGSGSTIVMNNGCLYSPVQTSNQFKVNGVPSVCGTYANTGFLVDAAQDEDKSAADTPDAADLQDVDTPEELPPGFDPPVETPVEIPPIPDPVTPADPVTEGGLVDALNGLAASLDASISRLLDPIKAIETAVKSLKDVTKTISTNTLAAISGLGASITGAINNMSGQITGAINNQPVPDECAQHPETVGCMDSTINAADMPSEPETAEREITFSSINLGGPAAMCPAPMSVSFGGTSVDLEYDYICQFADGMRPFILLVAWLGAAMIVFTGVRQ